MVKRALALGVLVLLGLSVWVPIAAAGGGGCHSSAFNDERGAKVDLRDACFSPTVIRIQTGQSVTWTNMDQMAHTVTGAATGWGTYDDLSYKKAVTYQFKSSGVFPYFCAYHPGMVGAVVVGDGTSSATTTQAVVPVFPTVAPPTVAPTAAPQPAPVSSTPQGVSNLWRILAIGALALLVVGAAGLAAQRLVTRRATVKA